MVIFLAVWIPVVCCASFILGAYVSYCKEYKRNPIQPVSKVVDDQTKIEEINFWK